MRDNTPPADDGDAVDESFESFDGAQIEPMASSASSNAGHRGAVGPMSAPGWTQRLSTRGKLARALIVALALLVALLVVLPHSTLTLPTAIARLLTPAPTAPPQPDHFTTGQWEQVAGPPVQMAEYYDLLASSIDPLTAYSCTLVPSDPTSSSSAQSVTVWVTHDAGGRWAQAALHPLMGTSCAVSPARDGSQRVTLSVLDYALDQNAQACAHSQYFLSEDDGATWRRIQHTSIAPPVSPFGVCTLWAAGRHLYLETTSFSNNSDPGRTALERSDDGGRSWTRADGVLAEIAASWYAQPLDTTGDTLAAFVVGEVDLWITRDAGVSWRRTGPIARATPGAESVGLLNTEANLGGGPKACHCLYAVLSPRAGSNSAELRLAMSHNASDWSPLPPLPVKGATAVRSGIYSILGATVDGKLLVLGADPSVGGVATPDAAGRLTGPPPRLWAWDSWTGRWELAELRVPCQDLQTCTLYATGAAAVFGAADPPQGTQFWLTGAARGEGSQPTQTFYRLFIPAD